MYIYIYFDCVLYRFPANMQSSMRVHAPDIVLTGRMEPWEVGYGLRVEIACLA